MEAHYATPLLLDAKREYTTQLAEIMADSVLKTLNALWDQACRGSWREAQRVELFRHKLREIPAWNSNVVQAHTAAITGQVPYLGRVIMAVFAAYVMVMTMIKLYPTTTQPMINFQAPSNEQLVHKVYVNLAREMYNKPSLIHSARADSGRELLVAALQRAVHELLPMQDILDACLAREAPQPLQADAEFFGGDFAGGADFAAQDAYLQQQPMQPGQLMQQPMQPGQLLQQPMQPGQLLQQPVDIAQPMFEQQLEQPQFPQPQFAQPQVPQPQPQFPQPQFAQPQPQFPQPQPQFQPQQPQFAHPQPQFQPQPQPQFPHTQPQPQFQPQPQQFQQPQPQFQQPQQELFSDADDEF